MKRPRKYQNPQPERQTEPPSPPEIVVLQPRRSVPAGPPVTPQPGSPAPEMVVLQPRGDGTPSVALTPADSVNIFDGYPIPRVQLRVVLAVAPADDPARRALDAALFASAVCSADRKLRLVVDPARSSAAGAEVTFVFTPAPLGTETAARLEKLVPVASEAAARFDGATLVRAEVVPQT
jgi:hypothetical protein